MTYGFPRRERFLRTRGTGHTVIDDSNRLIDLLVFPRGKEIGGYILLYFVLLLFVVVGDGEVSNNWINFIEC